MESHTIGQIKWMFMKENDIDGLSGKDVNFANFKFYTSESAGDKKGGIRLGKQIRISDNQKPLKEL